ncbi:hypothetical protein MRX96_023058 [Rhipicephalus microplus]
MEAFLAVEATFVDSDFAAHTYLLSFTRLTGSHTGAWIRCEYDATLLQWNIIAHKVIRVVTNNASSIIKAFEFARIKCQGSHTKCGAIVAPICKSTADTEVFNVAGLNSELHNATRWNSQL